MMPPIVLSGLVMGFGASLGCLGTCVPVLLPYTAAAAQPSVRSGFFSSLLFSIGRLLAYAGLLIVLLALSEVITISIRIEAIAMLISGFILLFSGLVSLGAFQWNSGLSHILCRHLSSTRSPLYLGILTGIRPCGPLLAALAFVLTLPGVVSMGIFLLCFWLASSILLLGIGVAGGGLGAILSRQAGLDRTRRIASLTMIVISILFIFQGISSFNI